MVTKFEFLLVAMEKNVDFLITNRNIYKYIWVQSSGNTGTHFMFNKVSLLPKLVIISFLPKLVVARLRPKLLVARLLPKLVVARLLPKLVAAMLLPKLAGARLLPKLIMFSTVYI